MKKTIIAGAILTVCSFAANAAPFYSAVIGAASFVAGDCPTHLSDDPRIVPSAGVKLAASCVTGSQQIVLAGCHTAGLVKSRSVKVVCATPAVAPVPACDGTDPATAAAAAGGFNLVTTTGASIMVANTNGGSLGAATVSSGTLCDSAGASAKAVVDAY
jgi:hypothetical protein